MNKFTIHRPGHASTIIDAKELGGGQWLSFRVDHGVLIVLRVNEHSEIPVIAFAPGQWEQIE